MLRLEHEVLGRGMQYVLRSMITTSDMWSLDTAIIYSKAEAEKSRLWL